MDTSQKPDEFVAITTLDDYQAKFETDYKERFSKDFEAGIKDRLARQSEKHAQALTQKEQELLAKYEIDSFDLLGEYVDKGKGYQKLIDEKEALSETFTTTKSDYEKLQAEHKALNELYLLNKANVDEKRIDDLKAFFKGKDEEITEETLKAFLGEYPEFLKKVVSVRVGGDDDGDTQKPPTDYEELKERLDKRFNIKR